MVKVLAGQVLLGAEEYLEDQIALIGPPKASGLDVLLKNGLFGREVFCFRAQFIVLSDSILPFQF